MKKYEKFIAKIPTKFIKIMDEIMEKTETKPKTYWEVIRKSIAIYHYLITDSKDGEIEYTNKEDKKKGIKLDVLIEEYDNIIPFKK